MAQDSLDDQTTVERIIDQMEVIAKRLLRTPNLSERTSFMFSYMLLNVREASPEAKENPSARGWNPFRLYRNHPDFKEAEAKLKLACAEAAAKIEPIQNQ